MWANVSDEEKQKCQDLRDTHAQNLPAVDVANVLNDAKQKNDPPTARNVEVVGEDVAKGAAAEQVLEPSDEHEAGPPQKKTRINTTAFSFWPDLATLENVIIPEINESDKEDSPSDEKSKEKRATQRRDRARQTWLQASFLFPGKDEKQWYGVRTLRQGATGRIGLWIRVGKENAMVEVHMASRYSRTELTSIQSVSR